MQLKTRVVRHAVGHVNPFGGKCIHGKDGAVLYKGSQVNDHCVHCKRAGRTTEGVVDARCCA